MKEQLTELQTLIETHYKQQNNLRILEAGCGSVSHIVFRDKPFFAGIDISEKQLMKNQYIDEKILGDIQTYKLAPESYDIIVCWNVLEHLPYPEKAIANFIQCIKKNGLIILALPNVLSLKGLMTKFTPHLFHIFIYRFILCNQYAGKSGYPPFQTYLRFNISPRGLKRYERHENLTVKYLSVYEGPQLKKITGFFKISRKIIAVFEKTLQFLTVDKLSLTKTDFIIVFEKKQLLL